MRSDAHCRPVFATRRSCGAVSILLLMSGLTPGCQGERPSSESAPVSASTSNASRAVTEKAPAVEATVVHLRAEGQLGPGAGTLLIDVGAPRGAKLTLDAPVSVRASGGIGLSFPKALSGALESHPLPLRLPVDVADGATGPVRVELSYFWCTDGNEASCQRERADLVVTLDLNGGSEGGEAHVSYTARGDRT
jgi:hypothetical protein